ncbi:hypothetical protein Tco_0725771 [Tanacetum coccineum]|uniref:Uncharacterized protein n=1 Tax=Tanacetum coccineum TaxID=301880 RepID=A0ABQ4YEQ2_9ASTR
MDGGDDGDDDVDDSSGDDVDDKDEDEEEEEEDEYLAPADSAVVVPTVDPVSPPEGTEVSPPEGTEPVIPPPSTNITTTRARITVQLQAFISLPLEAEVERLLAMTTPSSSPPISLAPPSARERLARCTTLSAHSSPPPMPSSLLPSSGCPTQTQTLRIASTQALIDAVTAALPSPPLPHYHHLYTYHYLLTVGMMFPSKMPPSLEGISEVGYGIRDTWVDLAEAVPEIAPMTFGVVQSGVSELAELSLNMIHKTYMLY